MFASILVQWLMLRPILRKMDFWMNEVHPIRWLNLKLFNVVSNQICKYLTFRHYTNILSRIMLYYVLNVPSSETIGFSPFSLPFIHVFVCNAVFMLIERERWDQFHMKTLLTFWENRSDQAMLNKLPPKYAEKENCESAFYLEIRFTRINLFLEQMA